MTDPERKEVEELAKDLKEIRECEIQEHCILLDGEVAKKLYAKGYTKRPPQDNNAHKCTCNRHPDSAFTVRVKNDIPYCPRCGGMVYTYPAYSEETKQYARELKCAREKKEEKV